MTGVVHPTDPSPPRDLTITRVFQHGIELNWIPPRETNGDIQHYIIKYTTQNGTEQEINTTDNTNYYNLTGLERGKRYEISIAAFNSFASNHSTPKLNYTHYPGNPDPSKDFFVCCTYVCVYVCMYVCVTVYVCMLVYVCMYARKYSTHVLYVHTVCMYCIHVLRYVQYVLYVYMYMYCIYSLSLDVCME